MQTLFRILRIEYPEVAWHIVSIMLHVFGAAALLAYVSTLRPWWLWIPALFALGITFYSGYYFELGFRFRRMTEWRYK